MKCVSGACDFPLVCTGSEFVREFFCLGESGRREYVVCRRVGFACVGGDRQKNVVCVTWCTHVRSFPVPPMKRGWFPTDDVDTQSSLSV